MRKIILTGAVCLAAGCAKQPESIAAVEVGTEAYASFSCSQLSAAQVQATQELENFSAAQRSAANGDAVGVFLLGLPLSSMSGGSKEAEIAIARGKLQAINRYQVARNCAQST